MFAVTTTDGRPFDAARFRFAEQQAEHYQLDGFGWGEKDFVFDGHFLAEWKRRLPDAEYHTFSKAGHYVLEDAKDELVPLIRAFIAREPARV